MAMQLAEFNKATFGLKDSLKGLYDALDLPARRQLSLRRTVTALRRLVAGSNKRIVERGFSCAMTEYVRFC